MVNQLGTADARTVRYAQEARWLDSDDLLIHIHNPAVTTDKIDGFYNQSVASQSGLEFASGALN